ncbi:MAG: hypothetical protein HY913_23300 [Desulfomonile tiedjei]|nr:hypothetical protein [Desulfomonile tiedjei]
MMLVNVNEETLKPATVNAEISLPLWQWKIIIRRAEALFRGDLGACLAQLLEVGFMNEIKLLGGFNSKTVEN